MQQLVGADGESAQADGSDGSEPCKPQQQTEEVKKDEVVVEEVEAAEEKVEEDEPPLPAPGDKHPCVSEEWGTRGERKDALRGR